MSRFKRFRRTLLFILNFLISLAISLRKCERSIVEKRVTSFCRVRSSEKVVSRTMANYKMLLNFEIVRTTRR